MRVHRLEVTAFGPFAATVVIDFEPLYDAGLFLLTGHTGAGKTSILDAICFGLFGTVPGARGTAKELKSQHAAASVQPSVTLDVTLKGRLFRLRRSPAWQRPSSRAKQGYVDQFARASAEEFIDGAWVALTSRVDEVGHLVSRILGMNRDQFCQVVMLPQGQFQTFLRAGAKERHDVLESLFETRRFHQIEKWLSDQRRSRELECHTQRAVLVELLARAHEVVTDVGASVSPPVLSTQGGALSEPTADFTAADFSPADFTAAQVSLRTGCEQTCAADSAAYRRLDSVSRQLKARQHALDEAKALLERQTRHADARRRLLTLVTTRDEVVGRERQLERAQAAKLCGPHRDLVVEAQAKAQQVAEEVDVAQQGCRLFAQQPPESLQLGPVATHADQLRRSAARVEALLPLETELDELNAGLAAAADEAAQLGAERSAAQATLEEVPAVLEQLKVEVQRAERARQDLDAAARRASEAARTHQAALEAAALQINLAKLRARELKATRRTLALRTEWLDLRERRLAGIAAELAGQLSEGDDCPVCGSSSHPSPAGPRDDHVDAGDESAALGVLNHSDQILVELRSSREAVATRLATAEALAGGLTVSDAVARQEMATTELERTRAAAASFDAALSLHDQTHDQFDALKSKLVEIDQQIGILAARRLEWSALAAARRLALARELDVHDRADSKLDELTAQAHECDRLVSALEIREQLQQALVELDRRLGAALADQGFADVGALHEAAMTAAEMANAEALNRANHDEAAAASKILADPALVEASHAAAVNLVPLEQSVQTWAERHLEAASTASRIAHSHERLEALTARYETALEDWQPLLRARDIALELSTMCAGTSVANSSKTTLSHYVLGARLQQVVNAANVRLAGVCSGRYQLQHTMNRGVGDARGGLGLMVLDSYTGQSRDPATLSGGETFYVSLTLALGLADLVRDEIGGNELSTLFVDEGFGSLDPETLDEVMDEIDSLRSGGRCVGLVSHLHDLKMRVPTQVEIVRTPHGSQVRIP
ncbi:MAG: SMC family ATPase [Nocardioidaceae bacterium]|nr:SMC family ATPase [Nocardioidaceae bacterium]